MLPKHAASQPGQLPNTIANPPSMQHSSPLLLTSLMSARGSRRQQRRARRDSVGKLLEAVGKVDSDLGKMASLDVGKGLSSGEQRGGGHQRLSTKCIDSLKYTFKDSKARLVLGMRGRKGSRSSH